MSLMAVLGRILQVIGWIWLAAGVAGQFFDLPVDDVFPGLILLVASRFIRAQAARNAPDEGEIALSTLEPGPRPLNPDRMSTAPRPPMAPPPAPTPAASAPKPEADGREELLEDFLLAGRKATEDPVEAAGVPVEPDIAGQRSSADMIADAKKRWSKRP